MVDCVQIYVKLHSTPGQVEPQLLGAFEVQLRDEVRAVPAIRESQVVLQEALLLQQVGYELAVLAPAEWAEICRLRCALQGGQGPRDAVTDSTSHLANRFCRNSCRLLSVQPCLQSQVRIAAGFVPALVCCHLIVVFGN